MPPRTDLEKLIAIGGGRILDKRPSSSSSASSATSSIFRTRAINRKQPIIIYDPTLNLSDPDNTFLKHKHQVFESTWLFNCISCYCVDEHFVESSWNNHFFFFFSFCFTFFFLFCLFCLIWFFICTCCSIKTNIYIYIYIFIYLGWYVAWNKWEKK